MPLDIKTAIVLVSELREKKDVQKAEELRLNGNQLFKENKLKEALICYNESLCNAPIDSPCMGIAFANRSAVFFRLEYYQESLENIQLAKDHNSPAENLEKLNIRREVCLRILQKKPEKANKFEKNQEAKEQFLQPTLPGNKKFDFYAADCLEMCENKKFGKHIISTADLKVGTVISIEEGLFASLDYDKTYQRCLNCLQRCKMNLLPCRKCCSAMFCSEECRESAMQKFHKFECGVLQLINKLWKDNQAQQAQFFVLKFRVLFEALEVFKTIDDLRKAIKSVEKTQMTVFDMKNCTKRDKFLVAFKNFQWKEDDHELLTFVVDIMTLNSNEFTKLIKTDDDRKFVQNFLVFHVTFNAYYPMIKKQIEVKASHDIRVPAGILRCQWTQENANQERAGAGYFLLHSLFNHRCIPNTVKYHVGTTQYVVVTRPVKAGEQLFTYYCATYWYKEKQLRHESLQRSYQFVCKCPACLHNYPTLENLEKKDPSFYELISLATEMKLREDDLKLAVEKYPKICEYLDKKTGILSPSAEICRGVDNMDQCFRIFNKSDDF